MSDEILRGRVALQENVVVETDVDDCDPIENQNASSLIIKLQSGSTATVYVFGSPTKTGTYLQMAFDGTDLTAAVATDRWTVLPVECFAAPWIKLVGDDSGAVSVSGKG